MFIGDFNINFLDTQHPLFKHLTEFCCTYNLIQVVPSPTHFSHSGKPSLIDLVFVAEPQQILERSVKPPLSTSDHNGISVTLKHRFPKPRQKTRIVWKYAQADFVTAREMILSTDWDSLMTEDVNVSLANWQARFKGIMEQ